MKTSPPLFPLVTEIFHYGISSCLDRARTNGGNHILSYKVNKFGVEFGRTFSFPPPSLLIIDSFSSGFVAQQANMRITVVVGMCTSTTGPKERKTGERRNFDFLYFQARASGGRYIRHQKSLPRPGHKKVYGLMIPQWKKPKSFRPF